MDQSWLIDLEVFAEAGDVVTIVGAEVEKEVGRGLIGDEEEYRCCKQQKARASDLGLHGEGVARVSAGADDGTPSPVRLAM